MKNNLVILCLNKNYSKSIGKQLADSLELFFVDLNDILEYNLINNNMLQNSGLKYYQKERQKTINSITTYENSLVCGSIDLFFDNDNISKFKQNFVILYLQLKKDDLQKLNMQDSTQNSKNLIAFEQEDIACKSVANLTATVGLQNSKDNLKLIKNALISYFGGKNGYWWKMCKRT